MGYGVYFRDGRWGGYGVPAVCDDSECVAEINRGLAYICGGEPGNEKGCGLFFCSSHLWIGVGDDDPQMCQRCCDEEPPFEPTPDTPKWIAHMLTDESWEQWRQENPERITEMCMPAAKKEA